VAIVDQNGELIPDLFGVIDFGGGVFSGTGNPGDVGVNFGVEFALLKSHAKNQWVEVMVTPAAAPA
jgi:immune inhibitor A